jgi:hypothetical protein
VGFKGCKSSKKGWGELEKSGTLRKVSLERQELGQMTKGKAISHWEDCVDLCTK